MRISRNARALSAPEQALAVSVFGTTLPPWDKIILDDGLGLGDCPWTDNPMGVYAIAIGPTAYPDCTSRSIWTGFGRIDAVFIHEMTHVWQYFHGYNVKLSSVWGQTFGDGYDVVLGQSWSDYNVEQEATIVENWYNDGMIGSDDGYQYVQKVVRRGGGAGASKTLAQLKAWTP
jgi:hypothetical protein